MGASGWADLGVSEVAGRPGCFTAELNPRWMLVVVPQGGAVAVLAAQAMAAMLDAPEQRLRSLSTVFAAQVALGPVEIEVTVLRRGRSMSQLQATVTNPGQSAGLTAVAVFGASRRGYEFTDLDYPEVDGPEGLRSYRDPLPEGIDFEFPFEPLPFWTEVIETRPARGRAPWEPFEDGPAEVLYWYRLDDPPVRDDGLLDPLAAVVLCDTMPGAVAQKVGQEEWFGPSADFTIHLFEPARPGWLLAHNRARHAGDGYASVDMALWDPQDHHLVAYATQVFFFAFNTR
jgi:acyl-CoA thioesterase